MSDEARRELAREWNRIVGPFYSRQTLLAGLAITDEELEELVSAGDVLRLMRGTREFFPAFQFAATGEMLPELRLVLAALRDWPVLVDDWSMTWWLCHPRPEFGGESAVQLLWRGQRGRVEAQLDRDRES